MNIRRNAKLLVEPPSVATGDIAFNLIIFFLVCASTQPDSGRRQDLPRSETKQQQAQQSKNIEIALSKNEILLNAQRIPEADLASRLKRDLAAKKRPEDRIVVVKSSKDTPYDRWISITGLIETAGGVVTLQLEEEQTVLR